MDQIFFFTDSYALQIPFSRAKVTTAATLRTMTRANMSSLEGLPPSFGVAKGPRQVQPIASCLQKKRSIPRPGARARVERQHDVWLALAQYDSSDWELFPLN